MFYSIINALPTQAKNSVLYSLVGSLNASILFGSQAIVKSCEQQGEDLHEEICTGYPKTRHDAAMRKEAGGATDTFLDLCAANALRVELHDMLRAERNTTDDVLPLHGTMKFMTQSVRELPAAQLEDLVKALNIEGLTVDSIKTVYKADAEARRAELVGMSSRVMNVAESIPCPIGYEEDHFSHLSVIRQHNLWLKMEAALNKARNNVVLGILQRRAVDMGDIPLITDALKEVNVWIRNTNHAENQ